MNQGKFKIHGGYIREAFTARWGKLVYRSQMLFDNSLGFQVGGS